MSTTTKTSTPTFNVYKVIHVIENDKVLNEIFSGDNTLSYNMLRTMAKNDTLPKATLENLQEMFDRVISKNQGPLRKYLKITDEDISLAEPKLPKHYGKKRILSDIESNQSKTELDRAMLALNNLRNIYSKLKNRGIQDKLQGTKNLNRQNCRDIVATVKMIENKLGHIFNKSNGTK